MLSPAHDIAGPVHAFVFVRSEFSRARQGVLGASKRILKSENTVIIYIHFAFLFIYNKNDTCLQCVSCREELINRSLKLSLLPLHLTDLKIIKVNKLRFF